MPVQLLIVGQHSLLQEGVCLLLRKNQEIGEIQLADHYDDAVMKAEQFRPDVILVDGFEEGSGAKLISRVRAVVPTSNIVVLSIDDSEKQLLDAWRAGVRGVLDSRADGRELVLAIMNVAKNETYVSRHLVRDLISNLISRSEPPHNSKDTEGVASLTARQREVLRRVARGETNKIIASALFVSEGTVRAHISSILQRLDVRNRVQAAAIAFKNGLTSEPVAELGRD